MKRILCMFFSVLMMLSCFAVTISAATSEAAVMTDLSGFQINGIPFDESKYPVDSEDTGLYVIGVMESNFVSNTDSPDFGFYIYVHNPSCKAINDSKFNVVRMGLNDQSEVDEYLSFGMQVDSVSSDKRFIRFTLCNDGVNGHADISKVWKDQTGDTRVYNIVELRVVSGVDMKDCPVKMAYFFKGLGSSLTCSSKELTALDLEYNFTNWISPNAKYVVDPETGEAVGDASIYDHYEINSVYFTIPRNVYDQYGIIHSIRAKFHAYYTTPILITTEGFFDDTDTKEAIEEAWEINPGDKVDVKQLLAGIKPFLLTSSDDYGVYLSPDVKSKIWYYGPREYEHEKYQENWGLERKSKLAYIFDVLEKGFEFEPGKYSEVAVRSNELGKYFEDKLADPFYDSSNLYSDHIQVTIDYYSENSEHDYLYDMHTWTTGMSDWEYWCKKFAYGDDSYLFANFNTTAKQIEVITDPSLYALVSDASYAEIANALHIGQADVGDFAEVCADAVAKDEIVVILRFGYSSYSCVPVYDDDGTISWASQNPCAFSVEKWVFRDVDVLHVVFQKDGHKFVMPVSAQAGDSYGNLEIFPVPGGSGKLDDGSNEYERTLERIKEALKWALIILAIIALFPLVILIFNVIAKITGSSVRLSWKLLKRKRKYKSDDTNKE